MPGSKTQISKRYSLTMPADQWVMLLRGVHSYQGTEFADQLAEEEGEDSPEHFHFTAAEDKLKTLVNKIRQDRSEAFHQAVKAARERSEALGQAYEEQQALTASLTSKDGDR